MSHRVFLHVGLPKSGTTYFQAVLGKNKEQLQQRAGLLYPGETWGRQVDAVRDVRRMKVSPAQRASVAGAWDRLAAEMRTWPGDSIVSMEWLCMAAPAQVRRITEDLAPAEVHVVFTVRDLGRTVPAAWQEFTQNRSTWSWPEFLAQVSGDQPMQTPAGKAFWGQQDMGLLLEHWGSVLPAERLHVVTLPHSAADPAELWRRMAVVLGIDPEGYDLSDLGSNASLGMESAELMRRVNQRLRGRGVTVPSYNKVFKHRLAKQVLAGRKAQESKVLLPAEYHGWVRDRAAQQRRAIEASGAHVVGDLDDLQPRLDDASSPSVAEQARPEAVLEAAVEALVTVALEPPRRRRRTAGVRAGSPPRHLGRVWPERLRGRSPGDLAGAAARRLRGAVRGGRG